MPSQATENSRRFPTMPRKARVESRVLTCGSCKRGPEGRNDQPMPLAVQGDRRAETGKGLVKARGERRVVRLPRAQPSRAGSLGISCQRIPCGDILFRILVTKKHPGLLQPPTWQIRSEILSLTHQTNKQHLYTALNLWQEQIVISTERANRETDRSDDISSQVG